MTTMLEARSLVRTFGAIRAVDDVSFTLERGDVLGFLGPNGAGKTTTMKMLTGYLAPTSGQALVLGHDVAASPIDAKRAIGYLPEGAPAYGEMRVSSFLAFMATARGLSPQQIEEGLARVKSAVHLGTVWQQTIDTLSKGFQRRVGLAYALLHDPAILILDEPTDGLDPNQKHEVRKLIADIAADKAIIISTHILEEVDAVCNRATIIDRGKMIVDSTPEELKAQYGGSLEDVFRSLTHNDAANNNGSNGSNGSGKGAAP